MAFGDVGGFDDRIVDNAAPPGPATQLTVSPGPGQADLHWSGPVGAAGWDVVRGWLDSLSASGGNFTTSTDVCLANNTTAAGTNDAASPPGNGFWYLVRPVNCGGAGSWNSGAPSQSGSRDEEISQSGRSCP